jgi:GT2 family glycosyltransferase
LSAQVAVAVVSWNTRDLLGSCLESLRKDAEAGLSEVWVVDNASEDGSPDLVRDKYPWVNLIASEENMGFGRAVNAVAARTTTPWVGVANADIRTREGALRRLLDAAARDPGAGALAPKLILPGGSTQHSVFPFPSPAVSLAVALGFAKSARVGDRLLLPGSWDDSRERRVPWAVAAFLLVRRDAWDAVGGFDEELWMYAEDLDLGWRLARAGFPTRYVPSAEVEHEHGAATERAWGDERQLRWQRNSYAWMLRRRGWLFTRAIAVIELVGAGVRYVLLPKSRRRWRWWLRMHRTGLEPASRLRARR